jgi:hypothetical protein
MLAASIIRAMSFESPDVAKSSLPIEVCLVRFEVLAAASMKMAVLWVVVQCSLVEVYRRFGGACYLP